MIVIQIIGLILIAITYYIHKHTYVVKTEFNFRSERYDYSYSKVKSPLWIWLLAIILNIIPFIIIIAFIFGLLAYIINCFEDNIRFKYNQESKYYKYWNKIKIILTKDV